MNLGITRSPSAAVPIKCTGAETETTEVVDTISRPCEEPHNNNKQTNSRS